MEIQDLIEYIIKSIVNHSEDVEVDEKETEDKKSRLFMITINDEDSSIVIGRNGRIIKSIRNLAQASNNLDDDRYIKIEIKKNNR